MGVTPRQIRRIRWRVEHYGVDAVMDQRGGRPRRKRIKAGTIELLCRLKRDVYADFSSGTLRVRRLQNAQNQDISWDKAH